MKTKALIIIFFALMLSAAAMASEKQRHIQIHVDAQEGHDTEIQSFRFDSDTAGFDLEELQLGESRAYVDEEGNNLYVVRTEDGFDFDINGRKFSLPDFTSIHNEYSDDMEIHEIHKIRIVREEVDVTN
jgi:hypothetical protein